MKVFNEINQWIKIKSTSEDENNDIMGLEYKILVVGDKSVGKSSLCLRFVMNEFNLEIKASTQSECYPKTIKIFDQIIKIYLIDIESTSIKNPKSYIYSNVKGVIIIYDITKIKTFENVDQWLNEIKLHVDNTIPFLIVGNKSDLKFLRNIDYEEALEKANALNCEIREVSCIDSITVKESIKYLIAMIFYHDLPENQKEQYKKMFSNKNEKISNEIIKQDDKEKEIDQINHN